ncbi:MAG: cadmium-translocating P-type ATPase [Pseudorhodoplanes sp.]|nr:MAG: cadmium-translocating P-type ATPase [Pseudorhodoplanes sp.]
MSVTEATDLSPFTHRHSDGTASMEFAVEGINCGGCIGRIEKSLKQLSGIDDARLNFTNRRLTIAWTDPRFDPSQAVETLARMGYRAHPFRQRDSEEHEAQEAQRLLRYLAVAGFAAMNIMLLSVSVWSGNVTDITPETRDLFHWLSAAIALPAAAYAGQPFFRSALSALRTRQVNMDVPISLGILLALGMSLVETANHAEHAYFDSAVMLIFFLLCGRYLDQAMRRRTRAVAGNLAALKAEFAHRLLDSGEIVRIPASAVHVNDRLLIRPGERIPADGVVVGGQSHVDESLVTGETAPRKAEAGAALYAGSINLAGAITLRVTAGGHDTLLDEIDRLLDKAVKDKSRHVQLADRAARYYAPVVHTAAAATFAGWMLAGQSAHDAIIAAISVLIITCPCALALAIPAVQVVAAGTLFRSGIFLNAGSAIERLAGVDTIVFDKTGTLTLPEPCIVNAADIDPVLLDHAARLALSSRHPLAGVLARHRGQREPFPEVAEEPGQGIRAALEGVEMRLGSAAFCAVTMPQELLSRNPGASLIAFRHGEREAVFVIHQALRPDAADTVRALAAQGIGLSILSGDRAAAVAPVARDLGISDWQAGLNPAEKVAVVRDLKARGRHVLMVGDGINDAPSLASADVSMSPITAADMSQAQADAVFVGDRLDPVLRTILMARKARRLMRENLWLAAVYNTIAVPIAMAGLVTPLIAAAAMSGSSLLVTLNALRARTARQRNASGAERAAATEFAT